MYWYNPKEGREETRRAPSNDYQAIGMLVGHPDSGAFVGEYLALRRKGRSIGDAMIVVGHTFRVGRNGRRPPG